MKELCKIVEHFQAEYKLQIMKHNEFSTIIHTTIKLCDFLRGPDNNVALKWLLDRFKESTPDGMLHPCPYQELKAYNLTIDSNLLKSRNLMGTYRGTLRFFDNEDANIIKMINDLEVADVNARKQFSSG